MKRSCECRFWGSATITEIREGGERSVAISARMRRRARLMQIAESLERVLT
jgi:hypothetical protein